MNINNKGWYVDAGGKTALSSFIGAFLHFPAKIFQNFRKFAKVLKVFCRHITPFMVFAVSARISTRTPKTTQPKGASGNPFSSIIGRFTTPTPDPVHAIFPSLLPLFKFSRLCPRPVRFDCPFQLLDGNFPFHH